MKAFLNRVKYAIRGDLRECAICQLILDPGELSKKEYLVKICRHFAKYHPEIIRAGGFDPDML